jgi:hypothetical protein
VAHPCRTRAAEHATITKRRVFILNLSLARRQLRPAAPYAYPSLSSNLGDEWWVERSNDWQRANAKKPRHEASGDTLIP